MTNQNHKRALSEWAALTGASLPDSVEDRADRDDGIGVRADRDAAESFEREFGEESR
jgi:hypothetical protein